MREETFYEYACRLQAATDYLEPRGWIHIADFKFFKAGKVYDLSAADLDQIDRIEREGLFVFAE